MSVVVRPRPKKNGYAGNSCAYCHYWDGDSQLCGYSAGSVKFDNMVKGHCVANGKYVSRISGAAACRDFVLSNDASKYAK